jgi:cytosine/adenosine deaminase-related metal-dependent hydrolase
VATIGGACCLGRPDLGRLEVGAPADLAVWPASDLADVPDAIAGLVLGPDRRVRHLLVAGRPVIVESWLNGVDIHAARATLARRAQRLWD